MAIIKRKSVPTGAESEAPKFTGLNIVAKPKLPLPSANIIPMFGEAPTHGEIMRLGLVAQSCGDIMPDAGLNAADRIVLLRTSFDEKNPQEQRYRNRIKNRATAITAMCVVCTGSRKLVTECASTECPLWAFRFGSDPFRGKRK